MINKKLLRHNVLHLVVGYSNDALAFLEDPWYDEPPIEPTHVLVERFIILVPRLKENDIMKCQYQGNLTAYGGSVAGAVKHVKIQFLDRFRQSELFPNRV